MKSNKFWVYGFFSLVLFIAGLLMNMAVVEANGCLMPTKSDPQLLVQDGGHFAYTDKSEINLPFLSDNMRIRLFNKIQIISPGDILLLIGTFSLIIFGFVAVVELFKRNKYGRYSY